MKRLAPIALAVALLAPQAFAGANPWIKSLDAAQKKAKTANQMIFVDLFAEWCGWCHRFEKEVTPSAAFQQSTDDMVLLRLNTEDKGEGQKFAEKYNVTSLPTFLVLTPKLELAAVIKGYYPAATFAELIGKAKTQHGEFMKRVASEAKIAKDYDARLQLARDFGARQMYSESEPRLRKLVADKRTPEKVRNDAQYELAVALFLQKKYEDSIKAARELTSRVKIGEATERARLLTAQAYMDTGNLLGAANEFRSFKAAYPSSPLLKNVDAILPQIERQLAQPQAAAQPKSK